VRRFLDDGRFFFLNSKKWGAQIHYTLNYTFFVIFALVLYFDPHTFLFTHTHTHTHARKTLSMRGIHSVRATTAFSCVNICAALQTFLRSLLFSPCRRNVSFDEESFFFFLESKKAFRQSRVLAKRNKKKLTTIVGT